MKENDLILVTDMQNVYKTGGKWQCLDTEKVAANLKKVIAANGRNVIFTRFKKKKKNPVGVWQDYNHIYADINSDAHANEMMEEFSEELKKYPLYTKSVYSSLAIPQVLNACRETSRKGGRVVIGGVVSDCCVLSTIFSLINEGIYLIYLKDGSAGLDKPKEAANELVLSGMCPLHLNMMTTEEYLNE